MTVLLTDGTLCGVFSALYHAFTFRLTDVKAAAGGTQLSFTDIALPIACDPIAAQRVQEAIVRYGGRRTLHECEIAMLSGEHDKHAVIFDYLKTLLSMRRDLKGMLALPEVLCFENLLKRIWCEVHRFEGFIRFSKTAGGTYYAPFSPDHDITALLLPHFTARYGQMSFVLHDTARGIVGAWNGKQSAVFPCDLSPSVVLAEDETALQSLWKTYYRSITVKQRPHEKQMRGYMPVRYWKYLPEKRD